jgi:hypothetical protein
MSTEALMSMIVILTIIIGGFSFFLSLVIKNESKKSNKKSING